jgi:diguanylate cyclase (GGDEF)-like protein
LPVEPVLLLLLAAIVGNVVLMALIVVPPFLGRGDAFFGGGRSGVAATPGPGETGPAGRGGRTDAHEDGVPIETYDRVVRVVSWTFILVTSALIAVTGLWPDSQPAILVLLAVGGGFVLLVHDLLPSDALGPAKFIVEGSVAITFVTLLVVLTGGATSPFFYAYPLIVAGAALVVPPTVTLALAAIASVGFVAAAILAPGAWPLSAATIAQMAIDLMALILIAYVAMVVAREQRRSRDAAIRLSAIDSLTGLFNRAYFFAALEREIARSARSGRGFCLLMMDLDGLKAINDRHGHFVGDRVLRGVGEAIRTGVRRIDTPARYGGDEFVVLLPETDPTGGFVLAEKIRLGVAERTFDASGHEIRTSLSIGIVDYPYDGATADELMISADTAMYLSKRHGKNRVVGYAAALAEGVGAGRG